MPGANDPDNRRMMRFEKDWTQNERETFEKLQILSEIRRNHLALQYGDFKTLFISDDTWVYARQYFDDVVIVAHNKSNEEKTINIPMVDFLNNKKGKWNNYFGQKISNQNMTMTLTLAGNAFEVLTY